MEELMMKCRWLTSVLASFLICLLLVSSAVDAEHGRGGGDGDDDGGSPATPTASTPCSSQLNLGSVKLPFSTNNFSCNSAWSSQGFTLMFQNTGPNLWSFVLTAPDNGGYISVAFSPSGNMVGSSAVAGWIPSGGAGVVKQYDLRGTSSGACPPDKGSLTLVPGSTSIVSQSSKLYMAFQLRTAQPETKLLYAQGSLPGSNNLLPQHQSRTSTTIDYTTGQSTGGGGGGSAADAQEGSSKVSGSTSSTCSANLQGVDPKQIPFDTASLKCNAAWPKRDFTLLYKQTGPSLWSFVLSAPDNNAYISVGFSRNGKMVGSSAMAGWSSGGSSGGSAKQYYLGGTGSGSDCPPDKGDLPLVGSPVLVSQSSRLYLAFQLNTSSPQTNLIYAVGPSGSLPGSDNLLATHRDMVSTTIDYTTGLSSGSASGSATLRQAHGALGLIGWGVLVPLGVVAARYCKHWDPQWFYTHIGVQITGFTLGVICILTGFSLEDKVGTDVDTHKGIGIFILVLGCLQVMAILARPDKAAKVRRYWNWYHHNVGRLAILFAVANIFYGLSLAHESKSWSFGFGAFLVLWVVLTVVLEVRMRLRS